MKYSSVYLVVFLLFALTRVSYPEEKIIWDSAGEPPGIYFHWYEPSLYSGFAPRTQDPKRVHIRLARGNQVRVTLVLADADIASYLPSLVTRADTYRELASADIIELSTNHALDNYEKELERLKLREMPGSSRAQAISVMKELNPGRVFEIRFPVSKLLENWRRFLSGQAVSAASSSQEKLNAANATLPGRLNLYALEPLQAEKLDQLISEITKGAAQTVALTKKFGELLADLSRGVYQVSDGDVRAVEFTTIYPAGTVDAWADYKGKKIPAFGVTGVWKLIPREKGKSQVGMVDYISTNPGYGFIIMLPYQYASGIEYNVFHNAAVRLPVGETPFLPKEWRNVAGERNPKQPYQNLWAVGRGPVSRGCTRLGSGHMVELRHLLPSASEELTKVDSFRSLPQCFDLFDIDGDGKEEVIGLKYFYAYRTTSDRKPWYTYARNERRAFYKWLYGDNVSYGADGSARLKDVPLCRFGVRKAEEVRVVHDIPLYEADYETEKLQFYKTKGIPFDSPQAFTLTRELARLNSNHKTDRNSLRLK